MRGPDHDLVIIIEAPRGREIAELIEEHGAHSHANYPPESVHTPPLHLLDRPEITFWTARLEGALVGCAALLRHADGSGELKSMFIRPAARGLAKILLQAVETRARELKLSRIDLETGPKSHAALHLYEAAGYRPCGPFAEYKDDPNSVFMQSISRHDHSFAKLSACAQLRAASRRSLPQKTSRSRGLLPLGHTRRKSSLRCVGIH